jgi:hypothetical protein
MLANSTKRPGNVARAFRTCAASRSPEPPLRFTIVRRPIASVVATSDRRTVSWAERFWCPWTSTKGNLARRTGCRGPASIETGA